MSERPTPESEREARLISERDEAREKLSAAWQSLRDSQDEVLRLTFENRELSQSIEGWENKWKCAIDMAARAELERDEARETVEQQRKEIVRLNGATNHAGGTPLKIALRERDEAREELHDIRLNLGEDADGYTLLHAVCVLQNERDEAREVLKRIAHASMSARHKEEDYAEWEKAVESLQGICEEKNFINE